VEAAQLADRAQAAWASTGSVWSAVGTFLLFCFSRKKKKRSLFFLKKKMSTCVLLFGIGF
jgi:Na+-driven multidrug efflux pump